MLNFRPFTIVILLYINDLPITVAGSAIGLYADDSSWYKTDKLQHNVD